jgi:hypothetical protein
MSQKRSKKRTIKNRAAGPHNDTKITRTPEYQLIAQAFADLIACADKEFADDPNPPRAYIDLRIGYLDEK